MITIEGSILYAISMKWTVTYDLYQQKQSPYINTDPQTGVDQDRQILFIYDYISNIKHIYRNEMYSTYIYLSNSYKIFRYHNH